MSGRPAVVPPRTVTPLPARGDIVVGRDVAGRVLRISGHPAAGRIVLSIWQQEHCLATFRLAPDDVPDLLRALGAAVEAVDAGPGARGEDRSPGAGRHGLGAAP